VLKRVSAVRSDSNTVGLSPVSFDNSLTTEVEKWGGMRNTGRNLNVEEESGFLRKNGELALTPRHCSGLLHWL